MNGPPRVPPGEAGSDQGRSPRRLRTAPRDKAAQPASDGVDSASGGRILRRREAASMRPSRRGGRVVRQRPAKPRTPVQIRSAPFRPRASSFRSGASPSTGGRGDPRASRSEPREAGSRSRRPRAHGRSPLRLRPASRRLGRAGLGGARGRNHHAGGAGRVARGAGEGIRRRGQRQDEGRARADGPSRLGRPEARRGLPARSHGRLGHRGPGQADDQERACVGSSSSWAS